MQQIVTNETGQNLVTTTALNAAALPGVSTAPGHTTVSLMAILKITAGTGTTSLNVVIRRGNSLVGPVVSDSQAITVTAGNTYSVVVQGSDDQGEVAGQQYCVTVAQVGATANGAVNGVQLRADW